MTKTMTMARSLARGLTALLAIAPVWGATSMAWAAPPSQEDNDAVGKITLLNRKAIEAYQNLNFDEAQRLLREALTLSDARGLSQHPIRARTCVTLGMVLFGGFKQRDAAIKLFQQALQISPEVRLSRALANPQIQQVFDEAVRKLASAPPEASASAETAAPAVELTPERLLAHEPVRSAIRGRAVAIETTPDASLARDTLVLGYRPAGAAIFEELKLQRRSGGVHVATIPASATAGGQVEYYIEARHANGKRSTSRGSSIDPIVVKLVAPLAPPARTTDVDALASDLPSSDLPSSDLPSSDIRSQPGERRFVFALLAGTGLGWASGVGEVRQVSVTPSGFTWASLGHLAPEIGYFATPHLMLGVQGRIQLVSRAQEFRPSEGPSPGVCGGDGVCSPARAAFAGFARAAWVFRDPTKAFRPYVSLSVGGGLIRHVAQAGDKTDCGVAQNARCLDTVAGGPFLFGSGLGFSYRLSQSLALIVAVEGLGGLPKLTAQADVNLGVAFRL